MEFVIGYFDPLNVYRELNFVCISIPELLAEMDKRGITVHHIRPSTKDMKRLDRLETLAEEMCLDTLVNLIRGQRRNLFFPQP